MKKKQSAEKNPIVQQSNTKSVRSTEMALKSKQKSRIWIYSLMILVACLASGGSFSELLEPAPVYPSASLVKKNKLSHYLPALADTRGDTEVLIFEGKLPGGTILLLGGTHPNEPASNVTAVVLAENINIAQGRVIVIHRANASAFTATEPQEGFPQSFYLTNRKDVKRYFQVGSRYSNILDGWPDPIVYRHHPSGQLLSGAETRNLNRAYPGRADGSLTEQIAWAITEIVRRENVDLMIDLHEAAPEYPVINAIVAHQKTVDIAAMATVELQMRGIEIQFEVSPENFHGLCHREVGDFTQANVVLIESAGAMQGRLRGETNVDLILKSKDDLYHKASLLGKLAVDFPKEGISLAVRVGRHLESIKVLIEILSEFQPQSAVVFSQVPGYEDILKHDVGFYLR